jgi:hypothetical protein
MFGKKSGKSASIKTGNAPKLTNAPKPTETTKAALAGKEGKIRLPKGKIK